MESTGRASQPARRKSAILISEPKKDTEGFPVVEVPQQILTPRLDAISFSSLSPITSRFGPEHQKYSRSMDERHNNI